MSTTLPTDELRLVFGKDWETARAVIEQTRWLCGPRTTHAVAVQLGKAGVLAAGLPIALDAVMKIADAADYYNSQGTFHRRNLLAAAEFVGTVAACRTSMELAPTLYRASLRVSFP